MTRDARARAAGPVGRRPATPKALLLAVGRQQLTLARTIHGGCSTRHVSGRSSGPLQHLVVALRAGETLRPDVTAGSVAWTFQVLQGRVSLTVGRTRRLGWPGELMTGPMVEHRLVAEHDAVLLVTIAIAAGRP